MQTRDVRLIRWLRSVVGMVGLSSCAVAAVAETGVTAVRPVGEFHVIATAHLDTQWRWTVRDTIREFLPETLRANFALFAKYPAYVLNFDGAFRYMLIKEYYPEA